MANDIKMLQALHDVSPRNLSKIARITGISRKSLMLRIKRMQSDPRFFLRMHTTVYHTNLGLRKCVVFAEAEPGMERLLFDCLLVNGFWIYLCRSYGMGESCTAVYAIPTEHSKKFEEFIHEIKRLGVAKKVQIVWSTCFQSGRITSEWFDACQENWIFQWDDWIKEVQKQTTDLPFTLVDPEAYLNYADETDVKMLELLEADATISMKDVSEKLGISPQLARFHYQEHLLGKCLIEGYEIFVMRYSDSHNFMAYFTITFHDYETFARFTRSLINKFFTVTLGKVYKENALIVEVFLPHEEFRKFIDTLSKMLRMKLVRSYEYAIQDLRVRARQTIWPPFFKDNHWVYDHKSHLDALRQKVSDNLSF
jgi:DNA-binding Lrp family transcriptional regulator